MTASTLINIRKKLREVIFPAKDILPVFSGLKFSSALDVGAGTGYFLELLYSQNIIRAGDGIEVNPKYFRRINRDLEITSEDGINKQYDLLIFNDVLHHVENKQDLLRRHIQSFLKKNGYVFIKDMNPQNLICKWHNRIHDLVFAGERIREISPQELLSILPSDLNIVAQGQKRIFLYDHYFYLFERTER